MIGETLKNMRNIYGFKAKEISGRLGVSPSYVSEIENGKKQPSLELLAKYADIFEIKVSSLILLSESVEETKQRMNGKNDGSLLIKKMMIKLINTMSISTEEANETN